MNLELYHYPILAALGVIAGFLNVMAGGGSLLTMPAMIFMGMSPALANGTNRIALLIQNATAVGEFRRRGMADFKLSLSLALCTMPGAIIGAYSAIRIDPLWFKRLLAVIMIAVLVTTLWPGQKKERTAEGRVHSIAAHISMIGIGFYGGFVQAGVGFILIALMRGLLRLDLVRINMHKVFIIGIYMIPSLLVFAIQDQVAWVAGLVLAVGTAAGAWLATTLQIKRGESFVKVVFAFAVVAMAIKLLVDL